LTGGVAAALPGARAFVGAARFSAGFRVAAALLAGSLAAVRRASCFFKTPLAVAAFAVRFRAAVIVRAGLRRAVWRDAVIVFFAALGFFAAAVLRVLRPDPARRTRVAPRAGALAFRACARPVLRFAIGIILSFSGRYCERALILEESQRSILP
jgi:hypothetical protein